MEKTAIFLGETHETHILTKRSGEDHYSKKTCQQYVYFEVMYRERSEITSGILLQKMQNFNLILMQHQTNPKWEAFSKITDQYSSAVSKSLNTRKRMRNCYTLEKTKETTKFGIASRNKKKKGTLGGKLVKFE